jgi:predicted CXXCH cytochrome family protein
MINRYILILLLFYGSSFGIKAQSVYDDAKNHVCLKCHSTQIISFQNEVIGKEQKKLMNPYYLIDTMGIKAGVHQNFDCTDCHSYEYAAYPHNGNLKLEPMNSCLDCHGGDPTHDTYQFDRINEEFQKSVHFKVSGEDFTCGKCHNQHTYHPTARNSENVLEIVQYSNSLCLSCHNDMNKYSMIAGKEKPEIVKVHNWLPNQELHFKHVRCIECHTDVIDSLMVSHNIMSKDMAVRNCKECHSRDSRLKASLYKYANLQSRTDNSSIIAILSNESYVIGSQQFPVLRKLSFIIFFLAIAGMLIHLVFRYLKK